MQAPQDYITIPESVTIIGERASGHYFDWDGSMLKDFTITGYIDSAAETYANENGFTFIPIGTAMVSGSTNGDGEVKAKDRMTSTCYLAK